MYQLANNVLAALKTDITGAAVSLVLNPLAGTPFNLPPAPTDAAALTYGAPYGLMALVDRLDLSQAKIEIVRYSARAVAGADYTYTGLERGLEGTAAQAWVAGQCYAIQVPSVDVLALKTQIAVLRSSHLLTHARDALITWNGASFKFTTFRAMAMGRGKHFSTDGFFDIAMPANGTSVTGFGGAANQLVAAGGIPIAEGISLWYEPNIGGGYAPVAGNFRLVSITADFLVPPHWIFIAVHVGVAVVNEKMLRVANGAMLSPWRDVNTEGLFLNAWVNYGAPYNNAAYFKGADQIVRLRGLVKNGAIGTAIFTLPAGYRPAGSMIVATASNGTFGLVQIDANGTVGVYAGNNTYVSLENITFSAEN